MVRFRPWGQLEMYRKKEVQYEEKHSTSNRNRHMGYPCGGVPAGERPIPNGRADSWNRPTGVGLRTEQNNRKGNRMNNTKTVYSTSWSSGERYEAAWQTRRDPRWKKTGARKTMYRLQGKTSLTKQESAALEEAERELGYRK